MPTNRKPEMRAAESDRTQERCAYHVLDHVRRALFFETFTNIGDEILIIRARFAETAERRVRLARWTRPDEVVAVEWILKRVGLNESERVFSLRSDIDPGDIEASRNESSTRTTSTAK